MKVLGRELVAPFEDFWDEFNPDIDVPVEYIEQGHSLVFEDQGADLTAPDLPAWTSIPDNDLAYHVAHQLTHIAMRNRGFPRTGYGLQYPEGSAEARIGGDIEEMVLHASLEALIEPFGFRKDFILKRMLNGALNGVAKSPIPEYGTPWFFTWAVRYCELQLDLDPAQWRQLAEIYESRSPEICELGEELTSIMREVGWGTREEALEALIKTRDTLGLKVDGRVLVIDAITGDIFKLQAVYDLSEFCLHLLRNISQHRIIDSLHRRDWIDCRHLYIALTHLLNDNIAWQHRPDSVLRFQRLIRESRIARAEYSILSEINV